MCACFMLFTETQATNRKSEGENITILTWQFEQSSNWQYLDFLMILYSTIFILEAFCKLKWITHIHLSCVCCLKEHFLFLFNRQYIRAKKKKGNSTLQNDKIVSNSILVRISLFLLVRESSCYPESSRAIPPLPADSVWISNILFAHKRKLQMFRTLDSAVVHSSFPARFLCRVFD